MIDPRPCSSCSFANPLGAASCVKCGAALAETPDSVHAGETLRDPDDLTFPPPPPSPLLRAVLRGEPEAAATPPAAPVAPVSAPAPAPAAAPTIAPVAPPPMTRASVEQLSPSADQAVLLRELAERLHTRKIETEVHYAGFLIRGAAFLIDSAVLAGFGAPLAAAGYFGLRAGMMVAGQSTAIEADETLLTILIAAWFAMATIYFTVLHRTYGQTIGKSLLGLRVRSVGLGEVGYFRSLLRTVAYAASSSFLGFGFLLVALTPRKRGWHDFLAGTCVVRLAAEEASS